MTNSTAPVRSVAPSAALPPAPLVDASVDSLASPPGAGRAVEGAEHAADVARLRALGWWPIVVWSGLLGADAVAARFLWRTHLAPYVLLRAIGAVAILALMHITRDAPSRVELERWLVGTSLSLAVLLGAVCGWAGGGLRDDTFASVVLLPAMLIATPRRLGTALTWNLTLVLAWAASTFATSAWTPRNVAQLTSRGDWTFFAVATALLLGFAAIAAKIGDTTWRLRRQLFASRNLGKYELRARLGRGGMGEVWSAWHPGLRRHVAVKIVRGDEAAPVVVARFEREVAAASSLTHPNTIRVFDYGITADGLRWYAMELLRGEDLAHLVLNEGPLEPARAVHLVSQAARALAEAHRRGIVHRDVKPENLFVTTAGDEADFVKVLDFGISKRVFGDDPALTQVGQVAGTPAFMAPEAALGHATDARADVYALGAVLYFCLAGHPPFEESSAAAMMLAHVQCQAPPPSTLREGIPAALDALVMRALAKDPEERPIDARAFVEALEACAIERWTALTIVPTPMSTEAAPSETITLRDRAGVRDPERDPVRETRDAGEARDRTRARA